MRGGIGDKSYFFFTFKEHTLVLILIAIIYYIWQNIFFELN